MSIESEELRVERDLLDPQSFVGSYVEFSHRNIIKIGKVFGVTKDNRLKIEVEDDPKPNKFTSIEPLSVSILRIQEDD